MIHLNSDYIRDVKKSKKLTMYDMAERVNLSRSAVRNALNGKATCFRTAWKLAKALDVPVKDIMCEPLTIGQNLAVNRLSRGLSRRDLAEISGVPYSAIEDYEADQNAPPLWNAYYLSSALGLTINECFGLAVDFATVKELEDEPN